MITKYFRVSAVLTLIGALIVGVLGNALWELLFKPVLLWISTFILTIVTLGIDSLRDNLYAEMAKGLYERSGFETFSMLIVVATAVFISSALTLPLGIRIITSELSRRANLVKAGSARQWAVPPSRVFRWLRTAVIVFVALMMFEAGLLLSRYAYVSFIINGALYLDQSQHIVAPYLTDKERIALRSRTAAMKTRFDFDGVNSELLEVAKANKIELPKFVPF